MGVGGVRGLHRDVCAHLSAGLALDGLLDFAVGAATQRLQQLVAVLQVVLVVVLLHAANAAPPPHVAIGRPLGEQGRTAASGGGLTAGSNPGGLRTGHPAGSGG